MTFRLCCSVFAILLLCSPARAGVSVCDVANFEGFENCVSIANADAEVVVASRYGRVVAYRKPGGQNVLWINRNAEPFAPHIGGWNNYGGEKIWIWPQDKWAELTGNGWPPPRESDVGPYECEKLADGVRLVSPIVPGCGARVVREIRLQPEGTRVTYSTELKPEKAGTVSDVNIAPWTIVQVPVTNRMFYARTASPTNAWVRLGTDPLPPAPVRVNDTDVVRLRHAADSWTKGGTSGTVLASRFGDTLFVMTLHEDSATTNEYAPGAQLQVCFSPDVSPCFPEHTGAIAELEFTVPLASPKLTMSWSLETLPPDADDAFVAALLPAF